MIRINLLPAEKRKAERTPLPRLALIMTTAAAATVLFLYIAWILLEIKRTSDDIDDKTNQLNRLQADVAKFDQLTARSGQLRQKLQELSDLTKRDVDEGWWRAVNALWDVINAHPRVWIDDLRVLDERSVQSEVKRADADDKMAPPYGVTMKCHVAGEDLIEMTKFRNALKNNTVLQETLTFLNINVDWKIDDEKDFSESSSVSFNVALFGPTSPPKRKGAPPPGGAASTAAPGTAPAAPAGGVK
jgi:hypothetical protein